MRDPREGVGIVGLATRSTSLIWFTSHLVTVIFINMILQFITSRAAVITLITFERLIGEVYSLVSYEVTAFYKSPAARTADVTAYTHV